MTTEPKQMDASEPRPMDPERLADARRWIAAGWTPLPRETEAELLADRDYQAQRADEAEERAKVTAVQCLEHSDKCTELRLRVREAESAMAEETRRAEHMQHERDEYAADNEAWRSEALRLRSRVRVEAEDVERVGVTWAHAKAWAGLNGVDEHFLAGVRTAPGFCEAERVAAVVHGAATIYVERPGLDILDEMARMEVPK